MEKVIVFVDDADCARLKLTTAQRTHWILVACAPRMTHRVSKWVSHSARENWRNKWADKLFDQVVPPLVAAGDEVTTVLAKGPLPELMRQLNAEHAAARVLDARRPKLEPGRGDGWAAGTKLLGLFAACVLVAD